MPKSVSFNRHMLDLLCREMGDLVKTLITRKPFVKGSIYELKRLCGKPISQQTVLENRLQISLAF